MRQIPSSSLLVPSQSSLSVMSIVAPLSSTGSTELLDLFDLFECATIRLYVALSRCTSAGSSVFWCVVTHAASASCLHSLLALYMSLARYHAVAVEVHRYLPSLSFVKHIFSSLPSWVVNGILSIPSQGSGRFSGPGF